jgi:hypothetical protein
MKPRPVTSERNDRASGNLRYLPTPAEERFKRYTSTGRDVAGALTNALVARELSALTSSRLPYPFDARAEFTVLGGMIWGALREPLIPGVFFVTLHEELARALEDLGPTRDAQKICEAVCTRTRNMTQDVIDLVFDLVALEFSSSALQEAAARVEQLYYARQLLDELERLSRLLRADATSVDDVRTELRRLVENA